MWYSDCSLIRLDRLEYHIREELNKTAPRTLVVLNPLKVCIFDLSVFFFWQIILFLSPTHFNFYQVVITNLESGSIIHLDAKRWPDAQTDDASAFYKVSIKDYSAMISENKNDFKFWTSCLEYFLFLNLFFFFKSLALSSYFILEGW